MSSAVFSLRDRLAARDSRRKAKNRLMKLVLLGMALLAILPLFSVFIYVLMRGLPALNAAFFLHLPAPVGEPGGGMANAILGTLILILLASAAGIPTGIGIGLYLSEYGNGRLGQVLRFSTDILASVPSIIVGLFAYAVVVIPLHRPSAIAGGAALAIMMVPIVARITEELLRLVPGHIREAGLALGLPRWKVILHVVLRGSMGGIMTGVMLGVARAAGETAPLLFTVGISQFWPKGLDQPLASLPVQIYTYAISPYEDWQRQAWAGALILVVFVLVLNLAGRLVIRRRPAEKD